MPCLAMLGHAKAVGGNKPAQNLGDAAAEGIDRGAAMLVLQVAV